MTAAPLFPLFVEFRTARYRPMDIELRWAGRRLHAVDLPQAPTTHQTMISRDLLREHSRGLTIWCLDEPTSADKREAPFLLLSEVRAVWGPPGNEEPPHDPFELSEMDQAVLFMPAGERQWLSAEVTSSEPSARLAARVAAESGEQTDLATLHPGGTEQEQWLTWSWPALTTQRQRVSLRAEGGNVSIRLRRAGWQPPAENPVCAVYRVSVADARKPPVVILLLDALRADRWGAKRDGKSLTPTLDALAEHGVLFPHTRCQVPYTRGSLPCIVTGRYPGHAKQSEAVGGSGTLAGLLREHGYTTVAITANGYLQPGTSPAEGFDLSLYVHTWLRAHRSPDPPYWGDHFIEPLEEMLFQLGDQPFLLFLHLMQPHAPYAPPAPFDTLWAPREAGRLAGLEPFGPKLVPPAVRWMPTEEELAYLHGRYDGNVAYGDHVVATLFDVLRRCGPRQEPIIVVLSDHGEALLEHNLLGHGASLYEENLRVPLCFSGPGLPEGSVIHAPVELVDVAPTVLELVGCPTSYVTMDGTSLVKTILEDDEPSPGPFVAACPQEGGGVAGRVACLVPPWKYIHLQGSPEQLYDLDDDPGETTNLADANPELCRLMKERCAAWFRREIEDITPPAESLTEEERQRLEALGYIAR